MSTRALVRTLLALSVCTTAIAAPIAVTDHAPAARRSSTSVAGSGPLGSVFCFGDGSLPTPCPCAPPDTVPNPSGSASHGCANSFDLHGAQLFAYGGSTSPDDVTLFSFIAIGQYGGFAFLIKGDAVNPNGTPLGDGVSCVTGALLRFGGHNAGGHGEALGTWQYPTQIFTTPISVVTAQAPNEHAYYQLYYRNAAANFCNPATANVSNAVDLLWQ